MKIKACKIEEYKKKKMRLVIGLMSGTSVDGMDAALVEISGSFTSTKVKLVKYICMPFDKEIKNRIFKAFDYKNTNVAELSDLNFKLGKLFAQAAIKVARNVGISINKIDLIASHGQTIYHNPPHSTLQIGEGAQIAYDTGCLTVSDFRCADTAAGGQAAPLVPYFDYIIFADKKLSRVLLNIGGISNITFIKKSSGIDKLTAFDTGPGNMIVDFLVKKFTNGKQGYDKNGRFAFRGKINYNLLSRLLNMKYIKAKPPKSTGRELFGEEFAGELVKENKSVSLLNLITTVSAFTAESIIYNIKNNLKERVDELIVSGGGAKNKFFMEYLKNGMSEVKVYKSDDFGINGDAKEAIAFAVLGNETIMGHFNNVPSVTGAKKKVILGKISQGTGSKVAI